MSEMRIEDYWNDGALYVVEMITEDGLKMERDIVVPAEMTNEAVREKVIKRFLNIREIRFLEFYADVLCMIE